MCGGGGSILSLIGFYCNLLALTRQPAMCFSTFTVVRSPELSQYSSVGTVGSVPMLLYKFMYFDWRGSAGCGQAALVTKGCNAV